MDRKARTLAVTERNRAPLYHQLFLILQGKIHDGAYTEGVRLPGEKEIAAEYNVSRITATRALNELAAAGLVVRERGRGTRVRFSVAGKVSRGPADLVSGEDLLEENGKVTVLSFGYEPAPKDVAALFGIAPGAEVQHAVRMWHIGGKPYNHLATYVPAEIGRRWTADDMRRLPLSTLLRRQGLAAERIDEVVTATLADVALAERLEVSVGAPLLKIVRTTFAAEDRPVEHLVAFYPPDRYEYRASLTRRQMEDGRR